MYGLSCGKRVLDHWLDLDYSIHIFKTISLHEGAFVVYIWDNPKWLSLQGHKYIMWISPLVVTLHKKSGWTSTLEMHWNIVCYQWEQFIEIFLYFLVIFEFYPNPLDLYGLYILIISNIPGFLHDWLQKVQSSNHDRGSQISKLDAWWQKMVRFFNCIGMVTLVLTSMQ